MNYWLCSSKVEHIMVKAGSLDEATKKAKREQLYIDYRLNTFQVMGEDELERVCKINNLHIVRHSKGCRKRIKSFDLNEIWADFNFPNVDFSECIHSVEYVTLEK